MILRPLQNNVAQPSRHDCHPKIQYHPGHLGVHVSATQPACGADGRHIYGCNTCVNQLGVHVSVTRGHACT